MGRFVATEDKKAIMLDLIGRAVGVKDEKEKSLLEGYLSMYAEVCFEAENERTMALTNALEAAIEAVPDDGVPAAPEVDGEPPPAAGQVDKKVKRSQFAGPGGAEKRAIYVRLRDYRIRSGPGCYAPLAKASGGEITEEDLREMFGAGVRPIDKWRAVGAALDKLGGKEKNDDK